MRALLFACIAAGLAALPTQADRPFHNAEIVFPLEHWHNHASMIVEAPNGDLLVCCCGDQRQDPMTLARFIRIRCI